MHSEPGLQGWFSSSNNTEYIDVYYHDQAAMVLLLKYQNQISDEHDPVGNLTKISLPNVEDASAGPIDVKGQYFSKRSLVHTNKWSTGYLKPQVQLLKELDLLELEDKKILNGLTCEMDDHKGFINL